MKAPVDAKALQIIQNHAESLDSVAAKGDPTPRSALPEAKGQDTIHGQVYWVESWLDGMDDHVQRESQLAKEDGVFCGAIRCRPPWLNGAADRDQPQRVRRVPATLRREGGDGSQQDGPGFQMRGAR